ncbi:MAG: two-component sensor histidine kinase [Flavobacteriales bacterium]|nr:MAG: two-component sensor histidine kinase [Flavobacteriales bacterium]
MHITFERHVSYLATVFMWYLLFAKPDYSLLLLILLSGITTTMSLLWIRRERKLLRSLQELIAEENQETFVSRLKNPTDTKQALSAVFQKRKEEHLQMNRLENYRREYIGNVAHELKTPIFSIQGYIDSVIDDPLLDRKTLELFLSKANKNADRLGEIVKDLDTITKYESGMLTLNLEPFDIRILLSENIEMLELQAKKKNISLHMIAPANSYMVLGDRARIAQVITNLGYNAIRYGNNNGSCRFTISFTGSKVIFEVADNGIGIPYEQQSRVFERFYRVDKHRNRSTGGSGLGLSICKHIVEAHGEKIDLISTEGAGSVFRFCLPLPDHT